jgi:hypothetical protein
MGPLDPEQHEEQEQQAAIRERLQVRGAQGMPLLPAPDSGACSGTL